MLQNEAREKGQFLAFDFSDDGPSNAALERGGTEEVDISFDSRGSRVQRVAVDGIQILAPLPNMKAPRWLQDVVQDSSSGKRKYVK